MKFIKTPCRHRQTQWWYNAQWIKGEYKVVLRSDRAYIQIMLTFPSVGYCCAVDNKYIFLMCLLLGYESSRWDRADLGTLPSGRNPQTQIGHRSAPRVPILRPRLEGERGSSRANDGGTSGQAPLQESLPASGQPIRWSHHMAEPKVKEWERRLQGLWGGSVG